MPCEEKRHQILRQLSIKRTDEPEGYENGIIYHNSCLAGRHYCRAKAKSGNCPLFKWTVTAIYFCGPVLVMALRRVGPPSGMVVVSRSNKPIRRGLVVLAPKVYHWGRSCSSESICPESISCSSVVEKLENRARILVQVTIYRRLQIQTS